VRKNYNFRVLAAQAWALTFILAYVQHYEVFLSENLVNGYILPQTRGYNFTVTENLFRITCASWMRSSKDLVLPLMYKTKNNWASMC